MLRSTNHTVSICGNSVNALQTTLQSKFLQSFESTGLKQLSYDAIRFTQVSLYNTARSERLQLAFSERINIKKGGLC